MEREKAQDNEKYWCNCQYSGNVLLLSNKYSASQSYAKKWKKRGFS